MTDTSLIPARKAPAQPLASPDAKGLVGDDAAGAMVSLYQQQKKIHARAVSGLFATWRWSLVWFTQLLFYGAPWLSWNQRQAVLFDLGANRFYIGPLVLYPQGFIYLTAILIISACALFLFTAVAGRLWCGFACPQTVCTEIFMWVERKIEGDRIARMKLDDGAWTLDKLWRKSAKQAAWVAIALWTGFTFVGYFTPIKSLAAEAAQHGVMDKMQYPKGQIRYDTQNGLAQHLSHRQRLAGIFRPQVLVYTSLLVLVVLALLASLAMGSPFKVDVVRDRASLARLVDDGQIENIYRLQVMNATESAQHRRLAVVGLPGITLAAVPPVPLAPAEARWVTVAVRVPPESAQKLGPGAFAMHFEISLVGRDAAGREAAPVTLRENSTFVVPRRAAAGARNEAFLL